jgi:CO dehydrogenase/acetyl-CoA synthase beta subunit
MNESLSSSTPRSGEVDEEEVDEVLERRCRRRGLAVEGAMAVIQRVLLWWWWDESRWQGGALL